MKFARSNWKNELIQTKNLGIIEFHFLESQNDGYFAGLRAKSKAQ